MSSLRLCPVTLKQAKEFVGSVHRHHPIPGPSHKFSIGVEDVDGVLRGVAIVGRPVARGFDPGRTLEVTRLATDGSKNACSMLYGAAARAGAAMGYAKSDIITYTLATEDGASLRAAGWVEDGRTRGGSWDTPSRRRMAKAPTVEKIRWRAAQKDEL